MGVWVTGSLAEPYVTPHTEKESYSSNGVQATVELRVPWEDRYDYLTDFVSANEGYGLEWPYLPGSHLFISKIEIATHAGEAQGLSSACNTYAHALLRLTFGQDGSQQSPTQNVRYTESLEPNGEMQKLPPSFIHDTDHDWEFRWGEDPAAQLLSVEEAPNRLTLGLDYVVKYTKMPLVPDGILGIVDHVNDDAIVSASLGLTFDAETLLANSPVITRSVTNNPSSLKWDVELRWSMRAAGWNRWWNPLTTEFDRIWVHPVPANVDDPPRIYYQYPLTDMSAYLP